MKKPFDTIVGPDGVWKDDVEVVGESGLIAREDFARRCLNAAVNLYGILTFDEFVSLYNRYAKGHESAVSRPMTKEELERLVDRLIEFCERAEEDELDSDEVDKDSPECWFDVWDYKQTGQRLIVQDQFTAVFPDGTPKSPVEWETDYRKDVEKLISKTVAKFVKVELKILPEDEFLEYEEPMYSEETEETKAFEKFLVGEYAVDEDLAGLDVWGIQGEVRCNGATVTNALEYIRDNCEWEPSDDDDFERLVRELGPVVGVTRTWDYRGHTQQEMRRLGLIAREVREDIPDVFGMQDDDEYEGDDCIRLDDLPKPVYNGPIDFRFVKDAARRDAKMAVYEDVRQILDEFATKYLARELKSNPQRLSDAAVRFGYLERGDDIESLPRDLFLPVGDFVAFMDDADGGPAVRRIAKRKDKMDGYDRLALEYFSNARYTWLTIEAVKAGCGMKCRDLMTGEELFLIDKSVSAGDVKGRTMCLGVVPMEDVYISSGTCSLVYLKDPEAELGEVLAELGLLNERPMHLSFHDQARFVEATARHLQTVRNRS